MKGLPRSLSRARAPGAIFHAQVAPTSKAAAATFTPAELLTELCHYTGAAAALTLPLGEDMTAAVNEREGGANKAVTFSIVNTGSGTATLTAATGFTIVGAATVAAAASATFTLRNAGADAWIAYRVA